MLWLEYSWEYGSGLWGPIRHCYKLYGWDNRFLSEYISEHYGKSADRFHPESIVMRTLLKAVRIDWRNGVLIL